MQERGNDAIIGRSFRSIPRPESELIPAGARSRDAATIETELNEAANAILYSVKSDNNTSAGDLEPDETLFASSATTATRRAIPKRSKGLRAFACAGS